MEQPEWEVYVYTADTVKKKSAPLDFFSPKTFVNLLKLSVKKNFYKWNSSILYLWCSKKGEIWMWHSNKGTNSRKFSYGCGHRRNLAGSRPTHVVYRPGVVVLTSTVRLVYIRCYQKKRTGHIHIKWYLKLCNYYRVSWNERKNLLKSEKRTLPGSKYKNFLVLTKISKNSIKTFRWLKLINDMWLK